MLLSDFLDFVQNNLGASYSRPQLRVLTNQIQNKILGEDNAVTRVYPDPYFQTTDLIYSYVASTACKDASSDTPGAAVGDIRAIRNIYSPDWCGRNGGWPSATPFRGYYHPQLLQYTLNQANSGLNITQYESRGPGLSDCTIKIDLTNNPGDTEREYFAEAYLWPAQLTSENVALTIPDDFCLDLLFSGVMMMAEIRQYGRGPDMKGLYDEAYARFKAKYGNPLAQQITYLTPPRDG